MVAIMKVILVLISELKIVLESPDTLNKAACVINVTMYMNSTAVQTYMYSHDSEQGSSCQNT